MYEYFNDKQNLTTKKQRDPRQIQCLNLSKKTYGADH